MSQPIMIRDGRPFPITAEQYALARAGKPIGAVVAEPSKPVLAPPPPLSPTRQPDLAETAKKAAAFDDAMERREARNRSRANMEKHLKSKGLTPVAR